MCGLFLEKPSCRSDNASVWYHWWWTITHGMEALHSTWAMERNQLFLVWDFTELICNTLDLWLIKLINFLQVNYVSSRHLLFYYIDNMILSQLKNIFPSVKLISPWKFHFHYSIRHLHLSNIFYKCSIFSIFKSNYD